MTKFRKYSPVNTNNYCESFHAQIRKGMRRTGFWHGRLDRAVDSIIAIMDNKLREVLYFSSDSFRMKSIMKAHRAAVKEINSKDVRQEGENKWSVKVSGKRFETVVVKQHEAQSCYDMVCRECGTCKHQYTCDCQLMKFDSRSFCPLMRPFLRCDWSKELK